MESPKVPKKRHLLTISKKLEIICALDVKGKRKSEIAKEYGIPSSTLSTIIKNRKVLEKAAAVKNTKRKRLRAGKYENLEEKLFRWYQKAKESDQFIDVNIVKDKAREIAAELDIHFHCSNGWLHRFLHRHDIDSLTTKPTQLPTGSVAGDNCYEDVEPIISKYLLKNIFSCCEVGLFYNLEPNDFTKYSGETCGSGEMPEERLTVLMACNAAGTEKLKPLVVGHAELLDSDITIPVYYKRNSFSWISRDIFHSWLQEVDKMMGWKNRNILLLLDRSDIHNLENLQLTNVKLLYLPTNDLSYTKLPFEQGIVYNFKSHYRRQQLQYYMRLIKKGYFIKDIPKWSTLDAIAAITVAWSHLEVKLIYDCFYSCGVIYSVIPYKTNIKTTNQEVEEWSEFSCLMQNSLCNPNFYDFVLVDNNLETSRTYIVDMGDAPVETNFIDVKVFKEEMRQLSPSASPRPHQPQQPYKPTRTEAYLALSVLQSLAHGRGGTPVMKAMDAVREFVYEQYQRTDSNPL